MNCLLVFSEETEYLVDLSLNIERKQQPKKNLIESKNICD